MIRRPSSNSRTTSHGDGGLKARKLCDGKRDLSLVLHAGWLDVREFTRDGPDMLVWLDPTMSAGEPGACSAGAGRRATGPAAW